MQKSIIDKIFIRIKKHATKLFFKKKNRGSESKAEIGRSEVVHDSLNPKFVKAFEVDYFFEENQTLILDIYDEDKKGSSDLTKHDFMSVAE